MRIEDAHTHLFSRPFFEALARLSPSGEEPQQILTRISAATGIEVPGEDIEELRARWLSQMDEHGIARMVTFASLPAEVEAVAEAAAGSSGRLVPYALVNPAADGADGYTARALSELGFRGLLAFPAMHHVPLDDSRWRPVLDRARDHGAPVVVHCGILKVKLRDLVGLPRSYDIRLADPLRIVPAANRYPEVTFVLPHFGGGFLREALMAGDQCENVWVDTSSSNAWMKTQPERLELADVFRRTLDVFGARRVLFGTDSSVFPRGYRDDLLAEQREALTSAGASEDEQSAIFGGNLAGLIGAES